MSYSNIPKINNSVPQNRCQITKLIIISLVTKISVLIYAWLDVEVRQTTVFQNSQNKYLIFTILGIIMCINYKLTEKEFLYFIIYLKNPNY